MSRLVSLSDPVQGKVRLLKVLAEHEPQIFQGEQMTTIYIYEGNGDQFAAPTENLAKAGAKAAYEADSVPKRVLKVELAKLGTRELLCALFNNETDKFIGTKEVTYTAGPRARKGAVEEAPAAEEDFSDI
jgi:hypothetical protein